MFDHIVKELVRIQAHPAERRATIVENMAHGLMCACNDTLVPYFGQDGIPGNGTRYENGTLHGYDDCQPES